MNFWKWKLCRACSAHAPKFADFLYWTHKNIPDGQHSAHFQKSLKVQYHSTLLYSFTYREVLDFNSFKRFGELRRSREGSVFSTAKAIMKLISSYHICVTICITYNVCTHFFSIFFYSRKTVLLNRLYNFVDKKLAANCDFFNCFFVKELYPGFLNNICRKSFILWFCSRQGTAESLSLKFQSPSA